MENRKEMKEGEYEEKGSLELLSGGLSLMREKQMRRRKRTLQKERVGTPKSLLMTPSQ